jgi:GNAT superfamily N-acetyltransferase
MPGELQVALLADHPDLIPSITEWLYEEWGQYYPDGSRRRVEASLLERCQRDQLPIAMVGFVKGEPIGAASLKIREMESHPQYEHWLGTVYVRPQFRRRGYGGQLVGAAEELARSLGLKVLHLYTRHNENLYANLGWETIERPLYKQRPAIIMRKYLSSNQSENSS